jgi:hypothetical protein
MGVITGTFHQNSLDRLKKMSIRNVSVGFVLLSVMNCTVASNMEVNVDRPNDDNKEIEFHTIPYGFYNENTGVAAAAVIVADNFFQPQAKALVNVFVGSNDATNLFSYLADYQLPVVDRLFMDALFMYADWGETETYQNGNPEFPDEEAGRNDSDEDNFIDVEGTDKHFRLKFKYVVPIGHGKGNPIHTFKVKDGLLVEGSEAGGDMWNPLSTGRTTFTVEPFYRDQDFEDTESRQVFESITSGVKFVMEYDNTDWYKNPSYGSRQKLSLTRDWGANDDSTSWTALQFEWSKFFSLPLQEGTRQRVVALNFWTSDVPTWNSSDTDSDTGEEVFHRAPVFEGSTLGGIDRQRGFAQNRFSDRSAINYSVEYRHSPKNNPFTRIPLVNKLEIPWWEWIGFVEVGRVAGNWSINDLHSSMKVSAGAGVRLNVFGLIIRMDGAVSEEGGAVQMFFNHTY